MISAVTCAVTVLFLLEKGEGGGFGVEPVFVKRWKGEGRCGIMGM